MLLLAGADNASVRRMFLGTRQACPSAAGQRSIGRCRPALGWAVRSGLQSALVSNEPHSMPGTGHPPGTPIGTAGDVVSALHQVAVVTNLQWNGYAPSRLDVAPVYEDIMMIISTPFYTRLIDRISKPVVAALLFAWVLSPSNSAAQGLPVQNGPMLPVALWWIGAFVLGLAMAYGIFRNRKRTRAEKELSERATRDLYAREARGEHRSGPA
jgi:hypothetical protein